MSPHDNLKQALRIHTADLHARLDAAVGDMATVDGYRTFVAQSYAFRSAVEPAISSPGWSPLQLADLLRHDLQDLHCEPPDVPLLAKVDSPFANFGRLYVLEGASVGARLLYKRAQSLGFSENFGARHLAIQAGNTGRWNRFVQVLDTIAPGHHAEVLDAAKDLFEYALIIYGGRSR